MSAPIKLTLSVDALDYDSKTNKYALRINGNTFEIDGDRVSDIISQSPDIDAILDEIDATESKVSNAKQQQTQPRAKLTKKQLDPVELYRSIVNNDIHHIKQCVTNGTITDVNEPLIPQEAVQSVPSSIKFGNNPLLPMLPYAVAHGKHGIVAMLINLGADHAGTTSLWWSSMYGHYHIERLLIMSKFGGSASHNITNTIRKIQFQTAFCKKLLSNQSILNDKWQQSLLDYMYYIIDQRRAFSDDLMMISWHYVLKTHSNPLESKLWLCLIKACQDVIKSRSKCDWFWLNQYVLKSAIWLQDHPINKPKLKKADDEEEEVFKEFTDESDITRMSIKELLFIELYEITLKQAKIEGAKLKFLETSNARIWAKLCKYHIETDYEDKVVRQDAIPNGLKPIKTKQELISNITPTYNPILFYDLEQYLPSLLTIAYHVNDDFQQAMVKIFDINPTTKQSQTQSLSNTKMVNTHFRSGPVKLITRCKAKVANEYFTECAFPSSAHLLDVNRCLLTFPNVETMMVGLELFQNAIKNGRSGCIKGIVRIKNGFSLYDGNNPDYADIKLNVIIQVGNNAPIIGEVQFLFEEMAKFKIISHKLYGILRLKEEYDNLCQVMPTLLSSDNEYQFLQCTRDSKTLKRLIVEQDHAPQFFLSGLNMQNICNHNGVKVLNVLAEFVPKKELNESIEAQSALRKACDANQLAVVECLLRKFDISMDEARFAYSVSLDNGVGSIIKALEDKFGKKELLSASALANAVSCDDTNLYSLATITTASPGSLLNTNGMILWLDSKDESTLTVDDDKIVSSWQCKVNGNNKLIGNESRPYLRKLPDVYCGEGVYFNYDHTATFSVPVGNMRTICSLHSMENSHSIEKKGFFIGGEGDGAKANFYVFTSGAYYSFSGNLEEGKICDYQYAHPSFKDGTIRLSGIKKEHKVKDCESWEGETKIAIVSLFDNMNDVKFDRIGRDRVYHHFSGSIVELIVYDRVLDDAEKAQVENYFVYKHFGAVINTIHAQCDKMNWISYCANYIVALLYGNHILQKFIQKQ